MIQFSIMAASPVSAVAPLVPVVHHDPAGNDDQHQPRGEEERVERRDAGDGGDVVEQVQKRDIEQDDAQNEQGDQSLAYQAAGLHGATGTVFVGIMYGIYCNCEREGGTKIGLDPS